MKVGTATGSVITLGKTNFGGACTGPLTYLILGVAQEISVILGTEINISDIRVFSFFVIAVLYCPVIADLICLGFGNGDLVTRINCL